MKPTKLMVFALFICMLLSFIFGIATVKYKIFPYQQLRALTQITGTKTGPMHSSYFYHKKSFFEQHGRHSYDVVFIGDSLTDDADWQELFPALKIANRGIDGDRTDGVLKRLDSIYSTSASKAFIMIGLNDFSFGMSVDEVFENYRNIVNNLVDQEIEVFIESTILAGKQKRDLNKKIISLNKRLQMFAKQSNLVTYIDINVGLTSGLLLKTSYTLDGVHLNGDGYAIWKNLINPYLQ